MSNDTQFIKFEIIIQKVLDNQKTNLLDLELIKKEEIQKIWIAFNNHVKEELDLNRKLKIFDFFTICYARKELNYQIEFNRNWLRNFDFEQKHLKNPPIIPIRKFFYENLQKFLDLKLERIISIFDIVIQNIENFLIESDNNLEIDLKYFGRILKYERTISFVHNKKIVYEDEKKERGFTVLDLIRIKAIEKDLKLNMNLGMKKKLNSIKPIKKRELIPLKSLLLSETSKTNQKPKKNIFKITKKKKNLKTLDKTIFKKLKDFKNQKFATHPASLDQNFSNLIHNPKTLMNNLFKLPGRIKQPPPLIFDPYSYTLACPLNLQYNSLSISSRIAINYTPLSKYLFFDIEKQKITILNNKENKALFLRQRPDLKKDEFEKNLSKKRYDQYLFEILTDDNVINFPSKSLKKIMKTGEGGYPSIKLKDLKALKQKLGEEIKFDFKIAAKKALLDYILKENEEKLRLGIDFIPDASVEYGEGRYRFCLKNSGENFASRKKKLEKELILFSKTTHKIVDCFSIFENESLYNLDFNVKNQKGLEEFLVLQREKISIIRNKIITIWVKEISQIYKKNMINQSKRKMKKYFDCITNVISQQIRDIIVNSLKSYLKS